MNRADEAAAVLYKTNVSEWIYEKCSQDILNHLKEIYLKKEMYMYSLFALAMCEQVVMWHVLIVWCCWTVDFFL